MSKLSPQAVADKYIRAMSNAVPAIKAGVMATTENPMAKAAASEDAWVSGVQRAKDSGKFRDGLMAVPFEEWKRLTAEKGSARIAQGVQEAKPKLQQFFSQLLPYTEQVSQRIAQMPKGTDADSAARMMANFESMKQFRFRKRA